MQTIYCIPGLGADENVFRFIDLSFAKPVFIKWIKPKKHESLHQYAMRLKNNFIKEPNPIILGLSLGGMIAVEIAKLTVTAKAIIISSAKTKKEIPFHWKIFQYMPLYNFLTYWSIKNSIAIQQYFLGAESGFSKAYINEMILKTDLNFYKWAVEAIITWQNKIVPSNLIHIHGTADKMIPYKLIKPDISIDNGGHLMIIENAKEISALIKQILSG